MLTNHWFEEGFTIVMPHMVSGQLSVVELRKVRGLPVACHRPGPGPALRPGCVGRGRAAVRVLPDLLLPSVVPALVDLVQAHGARLVMVWADRGAEDHADAAFLRGRGVLLVDMTADQPRDAERQADPARAADAFTLRRVQRAGSALH